jgi:hypothetical protein
MVCRLSSGGRRIRTCGPTSIKDSRFPNSPFDFRAGCTGCERPNFGKRRFRAPRTPTYRRSWSHVRPAGWLVREACIEAVAAWAIGAEGDPPETDWKMPSRRRRTRKPARHRSLDRCNVKRQGDRGGPE